MTDVRHLTRDELDSGAAAIRRSPGNDGELMLIVRRPDTDEREVLDTGELSVVSGLVGDNWSRRPSSRTSDGSPHPDRQLTLMNARLIDLVAQGKERWPLAGDQLFVDLDLGAANLPPGTRLQLGTAVIELTAESHRGCKKFVAHFGLPALKFISAPEVKELRLRGIYAKVVQSGLVRVGDRVQKIS